MDDIIDAGVDAKHSFEDQIMPVTEVKRRWGKRISILGGIDVDFLCHASIEQVRVEPSLLLSNALREAGML